MYIENVRLLYRKDAKEKKKKKKTQHTSLSRK